MEAVIGDYIKSDFFSPIQGEIIGLGTLGKKIPVYKIQLPNGQIDWICKGQAIILYKNGSKERIAIHD